MPKSSKNSPRHAATDGANGESRDGAARQRDGKEPVAVVGLGASAGGVAVLQQFFSDMAPESGLAFVVVMHLSPEYESNLASVLQQKTAMPVTQVNEPVQVERDHVYVIPPNHQLTFKESTLHLVAPQQAPGRRVTIDLFFRTLAQAYGQRAVCVILSGTDSDGAIGLKHIRAQGGVTMAQDPSEAEHESMPATAISSGMVDWVLPVAEMPAKLMEFVRNEGRIKLPPEIPEASAPDAKVEDAPGGETVAIETRDEEDESALGDVLAHLRAHTGHNFAHYKRATVLRRIARRLQVNSLETIPQYREFLRKHPAEARALLQDLLIGVTHFFRDGESFAALEANVPQLFAGKQKDDQLRVWVPGCATGEEAYSIAILLCEYAERLESPPTIQIFATDIDDQAIQDARDGLYPSTIEADVSQGRLRRFFTKEHGRYRVRKDLREKLLFASHNLLGDAPFSRLDLISCRNLLIYLNSTAQEQVFDIFHFALASGGLLFIGGSESSTLQGLFSPVDAKHRIFVRRSVPRPSWKVPILPTRTSQASNRVKTSRRLRPLEALAQKTVEEGATQTKDAVFAGQERRAALFGELHLKLLEQYAPPSIVVNEEQEIVHLSQKAGRYLQLSAGEPSSNIFRLINPALQIDLRTALFRASQGDELVVSTAPQTVHFDGRKEVISLHVRRVQNTPEEKFYLVLFEQSEAPARAVGPAEHSDVARGLDDEIQHLKEQLSATVEQYEASNEELKASNEELQAMNEEMRSTTEELETSKEELQSVNEELSTVNNQLKTSVEDLSRANSDLSNLMASTDIATVFLDRQLSIQRFTPSAQKIFNLIPADLNRPLADITHKLAYEGLMPDVENVLENLAPLEREVRLGHDSWFLARIAPYRTAEDRIAGIVATFIDITRRRRAELELEKVAREAESELHRFNTVMTAVPDFIYHFDLDGRFTYVNQALLDLWQKTLEQAVGKNFHELDYPPELAAKLQAQIQEVIATSRPLKDETPYTSALGARQYEYILFPLRTDGGQVDAVGGVTRDITDRREAEQALRKSEERFRQFAENSADAFWIIDAREQRVEYINPVFEEMWGESRAAVMGEIARWERLVHPEDRKMVRRERPKLLAGQTSILTYRIVRPNDGEVRWIRDTGFPIRNDAGEIYRIAGVAQDVTDEHDRAAALHESEERYRLLVEGARDYAIFLLDTANTIVHWNTGAERIFGWTAEEAVGQSGELIFTPEDRAREQEEKEIEGALRDGSAPDKRWHLCKDGRRIWVDGVMRRLDDEENGALRGFAKIARDATEERASEIALREARDRLEQRVLERTKELQAMNDTLEQEMKQRQALERQILDVTERERLRLSQDLHDSLCQELTATAFLLKSRAKKLGPENPEAGEALNEGATMVNRNAGLARDLARGLHPMELGAGGLVLALRELAARTNEAVTCRCEAPRSLRLPNETMSLNLYRIAQEAVTNAVKHAKAREIVICVERLGDEIILSVGDDGTPHSASKTGRGLGMKMMHYRASVSGGSLTVEAKKKKGTKITCRVPVKQ